MIHYAYVMCFAQNPFFSLKFIVVRLWKVQGKERLYVKHIAEQLGLEGAFIPRTYIEQIQLEKLVNDVMV